MTEKKPSFYMWTVGCQMNKADSAHLEAELVARGYAPTCVLEEADIVVLNSCVVRQSAENRVLSKLSSLRALKRARPQAVIAVTGCLVDGNLGELQRRFPHVDSFFAPQAFQGFLSTVQPMAEAPAPPGDKAQVCAFVPIISGCDKYCTYCIVPYRRGRERSRPTEEIICEVERLAARGVREVTLLGQNVDSYGHDLPDKPDLAALLYSLNSVGGLARIRFLTSHPQDMTERLIRAVAELEKVCEHINLPVQAGDDEILRRMGRRYTVAQYRDLVSHIQETMPDVSLSTDVIVGFPGEREEQFERSFALLRELRFDTVHVAAYSPRQGTASARLADDVTSAEKKRRLQAVEALQENIATEKNAGLVGQRVEVLVEQHKGDKWEGRTRINKIVHFSDESERLGQLVDVVVEKSSPWALQGRT
ncbi:MAG: tRNA (N6-isopentenyl adenosine(37)-C2)-methylthiotransferase MiaB [Dehalococcoidia bacterium]|nr:tRNA (N6-isopentenyl adenosine(37)-C2)-methylthiotransferase MiaB [Dehalococcoidia bacterium]